MLVVDLQERTRHHVSQKFTLYAKSLAYVTLACKRYIRRTKIRRRRAKDACLQLSV